MTDADRTAVLEELRTWATQQSFTSIARAAREGYAVHGAVMALVASNLVLAVQRGAGPEDLVSMTFAEGSPMWTHYKWESRSAPKEEAFDLHDRVRAVLPVVARPAAVELELLPIQRLSRKGEPSATVVLVLVRARGVKSVAVAFPVRSTSSS